MMVIELVMIMELIMLNGALRQAELIQGDNRNNHGKSMTTPKNLNMCVEQKACRNLIFEDCAWVSRLQKLFAPPLYQQKSTVSDVVRSLSTEKPRKTQFYVRIPAFLVSKSPELCD
jgi:hypothetical protein